MGDGVKFIFKTLIKVPVYIYIAFFILNIFAFCFTYFKMLGLSYTVQQIVVENNYIPVDQRATLGKYITEIDESLSMVSNVEIVTKGTSGGVKSSTTGGVMDNNGAGYVAGIKSDVVNGSAKFDKLSCTGTVKGKSSAFVSTDNKHQYGDEVDIGVKCTYNWIWPLDYRGEDAYDGVILNEGTANAIEIGGYDGGDKADFTRYSADKGAGNATSIQHGASKSENLILSKNTILIAYRVPGLKYYPDIE